MHPVAPGFRPTGFRPTVVFQSLPLTADFPILVAASNASDGAGPSVPFVASDIGWLLAVAALILGIALALEAIARRRSRRARTSAVYRRSDP